MSRRVLVECDGCGEVILHEHRKLARVMVYDHTGVEQAKTLVESRNSFLGREYEMHFCVECGKHAVRKILAMKGHAAPKEE